MKCSKEELLLYAVTDRSWLGDSTLYKQVEEALEGGATFIQLREKNLETEVFMEEAREIKELCKRYRVPFVINDSVEIALDVDADGVHVGQSDMEAGDVRRRLGEDKIIGVSAQTVEQALLAQEHGADYLGVGAVFPTGSKADATEVDMDTVKAICRAVDIPVIAIGGIGAGNVMELAGSGICGIAVISALFAQPDIKAAARDLKALTKKMVNVSPEESRNTCPAGGTAVSPQNKVYPGASRNSCPSGRSAASCRIRYLFLNCITLHGAGSILVLFLDTVHPVYKRRSGQWLLPTAVREFLQNSYESQTESPLRRHCPPGSHPVSAQGHRCSQNRQHPVFVPELS